MRIKVFWGVTLGSAIQEMYHIGATRYRQVTVKEHLDA